MNLNNKKLIFIITSICICAAALLFGLWNFFRFSISEPMEDLEYKKALLKNSHNLTYTLEALRPVMGENELIEFITKNDSNPKIYVPNRKNLNNGTFRATLHTHTTNSDVEPTVKYRLDAAQRYAENHIEDGYMVIAITDHNTTWGAEEVIKILEKNRGKYNKIKVVLGMEINTEYRNSKITQKPVQIHVLAWCINPYDKFLQKEFYKRNPNDKWNIKYPMRDFDKTIIEMSDYALVGPAHPARYTTALATKSDDEYTYFF